MDSFLQQTAKSILDSMDWQQLSRTTLVLPSHRAGVVLTDELLRLQQERHTKAVWAPRVRTLTQLQDDLSPLYAEDELFSIVRLYKIYRSIPNIPSIPSIPNKPMPLDLFYGWGRQLLADFTNVDASMPAEEVPNFFDNTIAAHELEQWKLDEETEERLRVLMANGEWRTANEDSVKAHYEVLWRQIYALYQALRAEMEAELKGYAGMRQRAVLEHWEDEHVQAQLKGRTFIFVGFNYLLPVERDLMLRLKEAGQARFYWDFIEDFQTNEKAFSFAQRNSALLGNELPVRRWTEPKTVTVTACVSREAQAQYVHRWLQENYTAHGQKVGVVICDETMLEPVIYALPAITLEDEETPQPINITKGFPLRNTAVYAQVLAWLNDAARGKADDIVEPEIIDRLMAEIFPEKPENAENPDESEPTEILENPDETIGWKDLLILESEYQVRKILNQMRLILTNGIGDVPFTLRLLRLLMRRTMENVTMPFHGEPVTDIQVMGVLETRMLDFDRLLLLNVEEGVLPQKQTDSSFIPYYLRKTYHMQTPDERATVYAYNFFRLLSRAGQATLLYATAETAEGGKGQSRFLLQMRYSPDFNVINSTLSEPSTVSRLSLMPDMERGVSLLDTLVVDEEGVLRRPNGKRYKLSPSALNTYISCPRSFYLQYILGLRPKEDEEVLFAPNTLGSFVHHSMEYIYREFLQCDGTHPVRVLPDEIEAIRTDETKMQQALEAAYEAMNALWLEDHPDEPDHYVLAHHAGENVVIKGYVSNILERDREDAKKGLQMYGTEQDRLFAVRVDGIGELLTGGRIDRMDIYGEEGNECMRVVDYKSGGYNDTTHARKMSSSWDELMESKDKGYVRQTLVYSHAVMEHDRTKLPITPHLFFCRRKLNEIETTLEMEQETVYDYKTIHERFYGLLCAKIREVLTATEFLPCAEEDCPSFCPFFHLCGRSPKEF